MDIYTIIFLALAVFIFLRLRSVLGQRTGGERPPYDRAARDVLQGRGATPAAATMSCRFRARSSIRRRWRPPIRRRRPSDGREPRSRAPISRAASTMIAKQDSSFDPKHFVTGAKSAYEMIVMAFAQGDRRTLKDLLSGEVFDSFDGAIRDREQRGERIERKFVGIDKAEIVGAEMRGRVASLTVRFVSQMISVTRDKAGAIVDGSPEHDHRCHRCLDVLPRHGLARSELEAGWHRRRAVSAGLRGAGCARRLLSA